MFCSELLSEVEAHLWPTGSQTILLSICVFLLHSLRQPSAWLSPLPQLHTKVTESVSRGQCGAEGKSKGPWNQSDLGLDLNAAPSWASSEASLNPIVVVSYSCCTKLPQS